MVRVRYVAYVIAGFVAGIAAAFIWLFFGDNGWDTEE